MSRPKKLKPSDKLTLTKRDLERIKTEIAHRTLLMVTAWTMDELDYDEEKIIQMWDGIARWSDAIDNQKVIKLNDIADIINKHTGFELRW